jgi:hypothetical protein
MEEHQNLIQFFRPVAFCNIGTSAIKNGKSHIFGWLTYIFSFLIRFLMPTVLVLLQLCRSCRYFEVIGEMIPYRPGNSCMYRTVTKHSAVLITIVSTWPYFVYQQLMPVIQTADPNTAALTDSFDPPKRTTYTALLELRDFPVFTLYDRVRGRHPRKEKQPSSSISTLKKKSLL